MSTSKAKAHMSTTIWVTKTPVVCPTPETPVWNLHPRVFLDIEEDGEVMCPYCSNHFKWKKQHQPHHGE